jgi:hypothetical protein
MITWASLWTFAPVDVFFSAEDIGMRSTIFLNVIKVRTDAGLGHDLGKAAEAERTTVSEIVRRELRSALAGRSTASPDDDPGPFSPGAAMRQAA